MRLQPLLVLNLVWSAAQGRVVLSREDDTAPPSPSDWDAARAKADAFVAKLTLDEKFQMVRGNSAAGGCVGNIEPIERLSFPGICMSDGPLSVARSELASVFPAQLTAAATWDKDLIYQRGLALGAEFRIKGVNTMLGPVAGALGRHPHGGRNWEGFSPDPYLTGVAMEATIKGVQKNGVQSCSKHFIGNEQETQRSNTTRADGVGINALSSNIDDRTLHELYLWPFADAVRAGTTSIMCAYSRLNQTYSCESSELLNDILKRELGFRGYVVSDWFATHSAAPAAMNGLDLEMPGIASGWPGSSTWFSHLLQDGYSNGNLTAERLDDMVSRILTPYYLLDQDSPDYPTTDESLRIVLSVTQFGLTQAKALLASVGLPWTEPEPRDARGDHDVLIRRMGSASTVLLKNTDNILPLKNLSNIGVFGAAAADFLNGLSYREAFVGPEIGPVAVGGGSGSGRFSYVVPPIESIKAKARETGGRVQYLTNNTAIALDEVTFYPTPEICLVFLSAFAAEATDRQSLLADDSAAITKTVTGICNNTVVVVYGPGVVTMPWADHPNVKAILAAHYPGQEVGNSIVDVLWGAEEPTGRLPFTIPVNETDLVIPIVSEPVGSGPDDWQADFTEGQLIDYRAFDAHDVVPRYEFGFGLSYTQFDLLNIKASKRVAKPAPTPDATRDIEPGGNPDLWTEILVVETIVKNVGDTRGHAVPQLYLSFPDSAPEGTPIRVLRGFDKVRLEPNAEHTVRFSLMRRDLSYWDTVRQIWVIPRGSFKFYAGFSSRDLRVDTEVTVLAPCGK